VKQISPLSLFVQEPIHPSGLWSLWDMMDLWGYRIAATLQQLKELQQYSKQPDIDLNATCPTLDGSNIAGVTINIAASLAEELDLESSKNQINTLRRMSLFGAKMGDFFREVEQLSRRIEEDLRKRNFLFLTPEIHGFWGRKDAFDLGEKFKEAHADIEAAGNCLAVAEGTACVMHLARAMDAALVKLGKKLKVPINPKDTWGVILNAMSGKINALPQRTQREKDKRDKWSEARVHLFHVKEAWRDRPMHAKQTYTPERAKEIYEAVRVFMAHFASL
jgi:hypothetical protein